MTTATTTTHLKRALLQGGCSTTTQRRIGLTTSASIQKSFISLQNENGKNIAGANDFLQARRYNAIRHESLFSTTTAFAKNDDNIGNNMHQRPLQQYYHKLHHLQQHPSIQKRNSSSSANLSPAVMRRIESMSSRHTEILSLLSSSDSSTMDTTSLGKELSSLSPIASLLEQIQSIDEELTSLTELQKEAMDDDELQAECIEEIKALKEKRDKLEKSLVESVLPKDENDYGNDAILEIRAGTGGDEACLFAGELLSSYDKECKSKNWKFEILSQTKTDLGGIKEAAVSISGSGGGGGSYSSYDTGDDGSFDSDKGSSINQLGPYGFFKFESGVHRVQRVPVNDVRIHTSAVSVAVLPATNDNSNDTAALLPPNELKIEVFRASGAGGQHVNTTESAVRITHIPTGITAAIQDERSQHKNKAKAMKLVSARVYDKKREEEMKERGDARNSLMGGGDRSERIRTYNYPQDRITDHRCKVSEHGIVKLFGGGSDASADGGGSGLVGTFAPFMRSMYRDEMLQKIEEEEEQENNSKDGGKKKGKKSKGKK